MSLIFLFLHRWKKEAAVWNLAIRIAEVIRIVERNAYAARGVKPEILQKAKMELFRETKYPAFNTIIGFLQDRVIDPNWQYVVRKADHDSRFHEAESVYRICNTVALVPKDLDGVNEGTSINIPFDRNP